MVLNSRIQIMGGRDTYTFSTDMEITTTMMRDTTSHLMQGTHQMDGVQGQVSVVMITKEVFSSDDDMGQMSVSHLDLHTPLELIPFQGETTGRWYEPPRVTVRAQSLSPSNPTIYGLVVVCTDTNSNVTPSCAKMCSAPLSTYIVLKVYFWAYRTKFIHELGNGMYSKSDAPLCQVQTINKVDVLLGH